MSLAGLNGDGSSPKFNASVTDVIDSHPDERKPIPWKMIVYGSIAVAGIIIGAIGALAVTGSFPAVIFHGMIGSICVASVGGIIALGFALLTYFQYRYWK